MTHLAPPVGQLALTYCGKSLPLQVLHSNAGWYIGTHDLMGPCSRESTQYWPSEDAAQAALDTGAWVQKETP